MLVLTDTKENEEAANYLKEVKDNVDTIVIAATGWMGQMNENSQPLIRPEDSTSKVSTTSSVKRRIAEEEAKRKALEAKMAYLEKEQAPARKRLDIKRKREVMRRQREYEDKDLMLWQEEGKLKLEAELRGEQ